MSLESSILAAIAPFRIFDAATIAPLVAANPLRVGYVLDSLAARGLLCRHRGSNRTRYHRAHPIIGDKIANFGARAARSVDGCILGGIAVSRKTEKF